MRIAGIGYQGRSLDELVERLRPASIATLIDVREVPGAAARVREKRLAARLAQEGIRYVHVRAPAIRARTGRAETASEEILARYREHLARTPGVLEEILAAAGGEPAALCATRPTRRRATARCCWRALAALARS